MYEDEPWDALEMAVQKSLFEGHAYGTSVLGTRESLARCGGGELAAFHRRLYRPDNAILVVAGDLPEDADGEVGRFFSHLEAGGRPRQDLPDPPARPGWRRVERSAGEVPRLHLAAVAPPADHPDHPLLRLLLTLLTTGRASRLQHLLVEEEQHCLWVSGSVTESPVASQLAIALELVSGAVPERVERRLMEELRRIAEVAPSAEEVERAKRVLRADWVFGQERVHQQALSAGFSLLHFDLDHPRRHLRRSLEARPEDLRRVAQTYLQPELGGVVGWSLPKRKGGAS